VHATAAAAERCTNRISTRHDDLKEERLLATPTAADVEVVLDGIGVVEVLWCLDSRNAGIIKEAS